MTYLEDSQNIRLESLVQKYEILLELARGQVDFHYYVSDLFYHVFEYVLELLGVGKVSPNICK